ncbi:prepilin-type N-terminal cleavage/methylation domain-containing protein [Planococcus sp. CP5-4]|uniref:PulJ/GspJ family protein n=1 Tax=unclassified Planococcus (in: firmicutes) TaxID=2662419 RepID=UPI001C21AEB1|nr:MULTISPECIES: prepilin-type N-terminal cleavage/methylation domain-containing protein [unclassified Planococcus (in: firmicutes)]MBU9672907.1 prepilin-type N-terminal cleavage/methylation domain-containing protein [Planococcus sp. CP5-4_YE]MBV0908679.1 prepilin-type N-terminal cleavage/methylation domain-containing protein [Planococcus sp. CP5-4_UN]MBW6063448.1 prepilin-type N-terminal cleavage/methylation domain-containing protein [Planococcus sp. CP5-4]
MNKFFKLLKDNNGVTLVELLATLVIVSIIGTLSYSVLYQGYANYQRIQVETELRDEADLIMASMIKDLFVLKKSEITLSNKCSANDSNSLLLVSKTENGSSNSYKTGFENGKVFVKDQEINFYNDNIEVLQTDCSETSPTIIKNDTETAEYTVIFTLQAIKGNTPHTMRFENTVKLIDDSAEVSE